MKGIRSLRSDVRLESKAHDAVQARILDIKESVFNTHRTYGRRDDHLLRLALNEAEALAWQTGFPQLVFPALATEKAAAAIAWRSRQECVQQSSAEIVLAV